MWDSKSGMQDLGELIANVKDEVRAVREQLAALPIFPKGNTCRIGVGQCPPQIGQLQNNLSRFETALRGKGETIQRRARYNPATTQELPNVRLPAIMHEIKGRPLC
jgi:hypothetical protein